MTTVIVIVQLNPSNLMILMISKEKRIGFLDICVLVEKVYYLYIKPLNI